MKIGYARISSEEQRIDSQIDALKEAGCERIFAEQQSASKARPELERCLLTLRAGDELVIWRLDRMGRSIKELVNILDGIRKNEVNLKCLNGDIDTSTSTGRLMYHFIAAFAEYEHALIRERTMAGLTAARARGRMGGRPRKLSGKQITEIKKMAEQNVMSITEICKRYSISRYTFYKRIGAVPPKGPPQVGNRVSHAKAC